jgi:hypothetical protein
MKIQDIISDTVRSPTFPIILLIIIIIIIILVVVVQSNSVYIVKNLFIVDNYIWYSVNGKYVLLGHMMNDVVSSTSTPLSTPIYLYGSSVIGSFTNSTKINITQPLTASTPITASEITSLLSTKNTAININRLDVYKNKIIVTSGSTISTLYLDTTKIETIMVEFDGLPSLKSNIYKFDSRGNPYVSTNNTPENCP